MSSLLPRVVFERVETLDAFLRGGVPHRVLWHSLVANRARAAGAPALEAILASLAEADASLDADLLDGLSVSERGTLYEYSLAYQDHGARKAAGQFFTPDDVAQFMAQRAQRLGTGRWLDPCCGVGNLAYWLAAAQPDPAEFLATQMYLFDRDPVALDVAAALLAVEFALTTQQYEALRWNANVGDALSDPLPEFDYAILNPPYVSVPKDERFAVAAAKATDAYFLERILSRARGIVAVVPQTFTTSAAHQPLREQMVARLPQMDMYCFDNMPACLFRGVKFGSQNTNMVNSTRAAIIVGGDTPTHPVRQRITPLLRWRVTERAALLDRADEFLAPLQHRPGSFPKVSAALLPLYAEAAAAPRTIGDLLSTGATEFHLDVPSTPRYFLTAVKRPLNRSGAVRLHFVSAEARETAYVTLNSSLAYWWWRSLEGGVNVTRGLLRSVPVLHEGPRPDLVALLEQSEADNVVVKVNAGKPNENVKHPWSLIRTLNAALYPRFAEDLIAQHTNSHLGAASPEAAFGDRA